MTRNRCNPLRAPLHARPPAPVHGGARSDAPVNAAAARPPRRGSESRILTNATFGIILISEKVLVYSRTFLVREYNIKNLHNFQCGFGKTLVFKIITQNVLCTWLVILHRLPQPWNFNRRL